MVDSRNCQCDVCKKAREMIKNGYSHYICIPASKLVCDEEPIPIEVEN